MAPSCPRVPLLTCPSSCWATMIASSGIPITFARSDLRRRNQVPSSMCLLVLAPGTALARSLLCWSWRPWSRSWCDPSRCYPQSMSFSPGMVGSTPIWGSHPGRSWSGKPAVTSTIQFCRQSSPSSRTMACIFASGSDSPDLVTLNLSLILGTKKCSFL